MMTCAKYVRRLVRVSTPVIMYFLNPCAFPDMPRFANEFCARVILTFYLDIKKNPDTGFFAALLGSVFKNPMTWQMRKSLEDKLGFSGRNTDNDYRTPSLSLHRALVGVGRDMEKKVSQKSNYGDEKLKVNHSDYDTCQYFTGLLKVFEANADGDPNLIVSMDNGPVVYGGLNQNALPPRACTHKRLCLSTCINSERRKHAEMPKFTQAKTAGGSLTFLPANKIALASYNTDPWTGEEKLALYTRYKDVHENWTDDDDFPGWCTVEKLC